MILDLPKRETLGDGRIMVSDSYVALRELRQHYMDRLVIEPCNMDWRDMRTKHKGVDAPHWGYAVYPFLKSGMYIDDDNVIHLADEDDYVFIIPERFRNTLEPGKYIRGKWENTCEALAYYVKNIDTGKIYYQQYMGGGGDIEYDFVVYLLEVEKALSGIDCYGNDYVNNGFHELLPMCTKRIGYILPEPNGVVPKEEVVS